MVFQLSRYVRFTEYVLGALMIYLFGSAAYAFGQEQQDPTLSPGGWLIFFVPAVLVFAATFYLAHAGAELVVDDRGLTTRHRGWRIWPTRKRLRIRIPRHLPAHEIGRVEAIHKHRADLGMWVGRHRGEKVKLTCSLWGVFTEKAIAVVQERPGLRRRLWLFDIDDPDAIAEALIRIRDTHNPGYLERVAEEERRKAGDIERRARIPNPTALDNSRLMPEPEGDRTHQTPKSFAGHREVIFDDLTLERLEPSPPFNSFSSAVFELTVTAISSPTPFADLVGPAIHLIEADNEPDVSVDGDGKVVARDTELKRAPLGRSITMKPGNGTFRLYPSQTATIHLYRRR